MRLTGLSLWLVGGAIWALAATCCAGQESCPWVNAATAAGFLGGPVNTKLTAANKTNDDLTCEFVSQQGSKFRALRVQVDTMTDIHGAFPSYTAQCGANSVPMQAIGNEAVVCSLRGKKHRVSEQIVSRVRDRAFIVRVTSNARLKTTAPLREQAEKIAEQVAGILF